jgi:hypothetical protein
MRLRLFPGRDWWPGRWRGRRATGRAAGPSDAADLSQPARREPGQSARAPGQPGSHRKTAARRINWPSSNHRPTEGPASYGRSASQAQTTTPTAGGQESASRNGAGGMGRNGAGGMGRNGARGTGRNRVRRTTPNEVRGNGASRTGGSPDGRSRDSANGSAASNNGASRDRASPDATSRDRASRNPASGNAATRTAAARDGANRAAARAAIKAAPGAPGPAAVVGPSTTTRSAAAARRAASMRPRATSVAAEPWYAVARPTLPDAGFRHCGRLEEVLVREWAAEAGPPPECITAVNRLADLPLLIKEKLAVGLDAIYVGSGGVPDLDDMGGLSGVPLPSGRATWDACAGAYGDRKIIVGSRPSPTPDVMCHEVGHALDDLDGPDDGWLSDAADFRVLYGRCLPHLASEFHRHGGSLGRREFFADAFAAIASGQRPALVEMLRGDTRTALDVMLYFNVRYGM